MASSATPTLRLEAHARDIVQMCISCYYYHHHYLFAYLFIHSFICLFMTILHLPVYRLWGLGWQAAPFSVVFFATIKSLTHSLAHSLAHSVNQSVNQPIAQSINQLVSHSINQSVSIVQLRLFLSHISPLTSGIYYTRKTARTLQLVDLRQP